ncbi:MAG: hypothetical protein KBB99_04385 [Bacilli bacterium]|nr:hypothetical protein [Bacilli bacterium]
MLLFMTFLNFFLLAKLQSNNNIVDLYERLIDSDNCRFIFNDSIKSTRFVDGGQKKEGVVQEFSGREPLFIIPLKSSIDESNKIVKISLNLKPYIESPFPEVANLYFRFYIEAKTDELSTRKAGISRSTIIYDVKINEKRNLPENSILDLRTQSFCKINTCFYFNILPNSYDLTFFDATALKNIRTLEDEPFKKYMLDKRVKKDELVVVFNKKEKKDSYCFFSVYSRERIGTGQFALAILVNIFCGFLLFIPAYRKTFSPALPLSKIWGELPIEIFITFVVAFSMLIYFIWPKISPFFMKLWMWLMSKFKFKK